MTKLTAVTTDTNLLLEQDVMFLQRPRQLHGLLVVDVVIRVAVDEQVLLVPEVVDPATDVSAVVARFVVLLGGQAHVALRVDGVWTKQRDAMSERVD